MSEIVLFHSALGLRKSVLDWAERLREDGHVVHTPDLYAGAVFDDLSEGGAKRDSIGIPELMRRAHEAVQDLPSDVFYAGFSMGSAPAEVLAAQRSGARGAILIHGALPIAAFGSATWPAGVPMQIHFAARDPWVEAGAVTSLQRDVKSIEIFRYDGQGHLFTDAEHPDYKPSAAEALFKRVRQFVASSPRSRKGEP